MGGLLSCVNIFLAFSCRGARESHAQFSNAIFPVIHSGRSSLSLMELLRQKERFSLIRLSAGSGLSCNPRGRPRVLGLLCSQRAGSGPAGSYLQRVGSLVVVQGLVALLHVGS